MKSYPELKFIGLALTNANSFDIFTNSSIPLHLFTQITCDCPSLHDSEPNIKSLIVCIACIAFLGILNI